MTSAERRAGITLAIFAPKYARRLVKRQRMPGVILILIGVIWLYFL